MINRYTRAAYDFTRHQATQSAAWAVFARDTISGFMTTARHALTLLGIVAIVVLGTMFVKPETADRLKKLSPFGASTQDSVNATNAQVETERTMPAAAPVTPLAAGTVRIPDLSHAVKAQDSSSKQQEWVTEWLAKRYRVAADATNMFVSAAYLTAKEVKIDPLLILSVMAIESGFNPFAESPVGAQGLMQVMSKIHHDKFAELGGIKAALNPVANIRVGSLILKDYVERGGSVEAGLKMYVGAGALETDSGYGAKVLAEYRRLKEVATGKKVPVITPTVTASAAPAASSAVKPASAEAKPQASSLSEDVSSMKENRPLAQNEEPTISSL